MCSALSPVGSPFAVLWVTPAKRPHLLHFDSVVPSKGTRSVEKSATRELSPESVHIRLGNLRLVAAVLFVGMAWTALREHAISAWWLAAPVAAFAGLAVYHSRILRARELGSGPSRFMRTDRPGSKIAGPYRERRASVSTIRITCMRRTSIRLGRAACFSSFRRRVRTGEETLAAWLLASSPVERFCSGRDAVLELRDELDLREELAVLGEDAGVGVHPEALLKWAESANQMRPLWMRWLAFGLAGLAVLAGVVWAVWGMAAPFVLVVLTEGILTYSLRTPIDEVLHGTEHAFRDLDLLSSVLARVEAHAVQAPRLQALQRHLLSGGVSASQAIARLRTLVNLIDSRHGVFVRILDAPLMYSVQLAFATERWRALHGPSLRLWVEAIAEMEALLSLAAYSFEHHEDPFPEFSEGAAAFEGEELGHPLVPAAICVRNHVSIGGETRVLLVSGSNMSGKSTLLRAVGMNFVLAMAGAPVRAKRLRMTPLQVGASIRVNDSLREGSSRFYAEITRLRQIFDLAGKNPSLLFLLDELLQGTNSKDRRIGAEGIVSALMIVARWAREHP